MRRQDRPALVVPQLAGVRRGEPEPAQLFLKLDLPEALDAEASRRVTASLIHVADGEPD